MKPAVLVLEDGSVFEGMAFGAEKETFGEVVFNTGMTGYQEVLTDPSYEGQIVAMTSSHIGNYGTNDLDSESRKPWVRGFVVRDVPEHWSSWRGTRGLPQYLSDHAIAGITEVDTRRLTRHVRSRGAMRSVISTRTGDIEALLSAVASTPEMAGADLAAGVSAPSRYRWEPGSTATDARFRVAAVDFGIKHSILRVLASHGCEITVFPAATDAQEILAEKPDGVFLSNGPGDPAAVGYGIETVRRLAGKVPIFGICLGHQLLALAAGLSTYKLAFGHRGLNHPVKRLADGAVEITTQNHGFAVSAETFRIESPPTSEPGCRTKLGPVRLTHLNLNDHTVEGLRFEGIPAFSVQYHPEAGPGPHDAHYLFERFTSMMAAGTTRPGR